MVLDEPTAALDAETEHALFDSFAEAARSTTVGGITILVSHRFSTVRMADLIIVLDGSRLVEVGSHHRADSPRRPLRGPLPAASECLSVSKPRHANFLDGHQQPSVGPALSSTRQPPRLATVTRLSVRLLGFVAAVMLGVFAAMVAPPGKAYACDCAGIST